jgi:hypothetical protein
MKYLQFILHTKEHRVRFRISEAPQAFSIVGQDFRLGVTAVNTKRIRLHHNIASAFGGLAIPLLTFKFSIVTKSVLLPNLCNSWLKLSKSKNSTILTPHPRITI